LRFFDDFEDFDALEDLEAFEELDFLEELDVLVDDELLELDFDDELFPELLEEDFEEVFFVSEELFCSFLAVAAMVKGMSMQSERAATAMVINKNIRRIVNPAIPLGEVSPLARAEH